MIKKFRPPPVNDTVDFQPQVDAMNVPHQDQITKSCAVAPMTRADDEAPLMAADHQLGHDPAISGWLARNSQVLCSSSDSGG